MTNQWRKPFDNDVLCEAIGIAVDMPTAWLLSATSGWSADAWSQAVDFSPYVPVGTKMAYCSLRFFATTASNLLLYARRYGDEEVTATPYALGEVGCLISETVGSSYAACSPVWLPLSIDGRVQFAVHAVPVQPSLYISFPRAYML